MKRILVVSIMTLAVLGGVASADRGHRGGRGRGHAGWSGGWSGGVRVHAPRVVVRPRVIVQPAPAQRFMKIVRDASPPGCTVCDGSIVMRSITGPAAWATEDASTITNPNRSFIWGPW